MYRPAHLPEVFFNARLLDIVTDAGRDVLLFDYQGNTIQLLTFEGSAERCAKAKAEDKTLAEIGQIGAVMPGLCEGEKEERRYRFQPYIDQSLRRAFELDVFEHVPPIGSRGYNAERIGWRNEACVDGFLAPAGIIPGENGGFIEDNTEALELDVPPEFFALCEQFKQTPERVLRGFIADAAGLASYVTRPRADGFDNNGSDERDIAYGYIERAYGMWRED